MSTHLEFEIDSINTFLDQTFTLPREKRVTSVALKLHFFNNPPGTFIVELKEGATVRSGASEFLAEEAAKGPGRAKTIRKAATKMAITQDVQMDL